MLPEQPRECFALTTPSGHQARYLSRSRASGNEYLQVQVRPTPPSTVHQVEDDTEAPPAKAAPMQPEPLAALMEAMTQLTKQVSQLQELARPATTKKGPLYWKCHRPGHLQRQCPAHQKLSRNDGSQR